MSVLLYGSVAESTLESSAVAAVAAIAIAAVTDKAGALRFLVVLRFGC